MQTSAQVGQTRCWRMDLRNVRIVRFAFGVTVAMAFAQAGAWPLSFIHVALVIALLNANTLPGPTPRQTFANFGYVIMACAFGVIFTLFFVPFPIAFMVAYTLVVFLSIYNMHKGAPFLLCLLLIISLLVLPLLGTVYEGLSLLVTASLAFSAVLSVLLVQIAYGLFPDPADTPQQPAAIYQPGYSPSAARSALQATAVIVPATIVFLAFQWKSELVVLIYTGIIALGGSVAASAYSFSKTLIANTIGALGAIGFYIALAIVPEFYFLILLMLFTSLMFAAKLFSGDVDAKYYASALTGLVILISSSLGPGADIDANAVQRIIYILLAGTYVAIAMPVSERLIARILPEPGPS
jgi:hypothetical protein